MSIIYKATVSRSSLDDIFFLETNPNSATPFAPFVFSNSGPLPSGHVGHDPSLFPGVIDYCYEPAITWSELNTRKNELRPDLLSLFLSMNIQMILDNPSIYGLYPMWNPFSLSWTFLTTFDTYENALTSIDLIHASDSDMLGRITRAGNTVTYEELLIDGVPDPIFVKRFV